MKKIVVVLTACAAVAFAGDLTTAAARWWSHVEYLASDDLEGRDTGTPGHRKAAEYVAAQFKKMGLKPAGSGGGYVQPVPFESRRIREPQSRLSLVFPDGAKPVKLGEEANFGLRGASDRPLDAPAVFVGYGLKIPELGIDDFAGLDLKGKIAVYLSGAPANVPGPLAAHSQSTGERAKALKEAGAIGYASINNPRRSDVPWSRATLARFMPQMTLDDDKLNEVAWQKLNLTINPEKAGPFFERSGHTIDEILAADRAGQALPRFVLPYRINANVVFEQQKLASENVAAILPGSDPKLKDEYVVLTAHLDHVGIGEPIGGDKVFNGAMDNASGVAAILEIARLLTEEKRRLKRSVLFVAVTGEEKGLQGSRYFANYPTVPAKSMVANVNLDMFLPLFPLRNIVVYGIDESDLGDLVRKVAPEFGVGIVADREPQRNIFIRSDQYSFIRRGVPALSFKFDAEPGSAEDKAMKEWLRVRYHAPSDDLKQPLDKEAAAKFVRVLAAFSERVANQDARPRWHEKSFFRRFATN